MRDQSSVFIAFCDLLFAVLAVVIVAVNPKHTNKAIDSPASFLIQATWEIEHSDADIDLWVLPPPGEIPVYYRNREVGLTMLDQDCLGKSNSIAMLADGSSVVAKTCRETITQRGYVPGKYDVALNLYHMNDEHGAQVPDDARGLGVKVHVEITRINPMVRQEWQGDFTLDYVKETLNLVSFELTAGHDFKLVTPPAEPITNRFLAQ